MNNRIKAALGRFGYPVVADCYTGDEPICFTFSYDAAGGIFADGSPVNLIYYVTVHLFCPRTYDSVALRGEVAAALYDAGFTWPEIENGSDASEQHYIFTCEGV